MGNFGCQGGWPDYAFNYVIYYNLTTADRYPYLDGQGNCKKVGGEYRIAKYKYSGILNPCDDLAHLLEERPVTISVDAKPWQFYAQGLFNGCNNNAGTVNHAVLLVGKDESGNWLIQNSWGLKWGDSGFMTLLGGNSCGICMYPGAAPSL